MFTCERMCYNINEGQRKSKKDGDEMSVLSNRIESFIKELMTDDEPTASIQMNELADLTAHYYDRGYWRNEKYTV